MYVSRNCSSCHAVGGVGGTLGPPLDGIGEIRDKQWLVGHLLNPALAPQSFGHRRNVMPHINLSTTEASSIAQYLLTLPEPKRGFLIAAHGTLDQPPQPSSRAKPEQAVADASSIEKGKQAFIEHHCAMCHAVEGAYGRFGPRLDGISLKYDRQSLEHLLEGQGKYEAMNGITVKLDESQRASIIDFLLSLPDPYKSR